MPDRGPNEDSGSSSRESICAAQPEGAVHMDLPHDLMTYSEHDVASSGAKQPQADAQAGPCPMPDGSRDATAPDAASPSRAHSANQTMIKLLLM
jgi:hypothetical protein